MDSWIKYGPASMLKDAAENSGRPRRANPKKEGERRREATAPAPEPIPAGVTEQAH